MIGGCYATFGGMLPPEGARDIYGDSETISAGAFRPGGVAVEVEDGFRITGRWTLASGSSHANWYVGGCVIHKDGEPVMGPLGFPVMREFFFPASVIEIIDTWDSTGLRGTASHDYAVRDVFVPRSRTMWFQEPPASDRPLYRMPPVAMFSTFISAVPLGIARHAIDEFVTLADAKTRSCPTARWPTNRRRRIDSAGRTLSSAPVVNTSPRRSTASGSRCEPGTRRRWGTAARCGSPPPTPPTALCRRSNSCTPPAARPVSTAVPPGSLPAGCPHRGAAHLHPGGEL